MQQDFTALAPGSPLGRDMTYLRCWEGVVYLSFVIDVFSRRVVGWQLAAHMRISLVLDALAMAVGTRVPGADFQLVAHSDRGSQYTSGSTPRLSMTTASWARSDRSETRWITPSPRASWTR